MEKEYSLDINVIPVEEHDGSFVRYEDHAAIVAALQEQVRALAADGAIMQAAIDQTIGWQQSVDAGNTESVRCLVAIQGKTPRIDAALREIRADGAMACGVHLREWYDYQVEERAEEFSAAIRTGEQP